jgi:fructose-1,6-bisphosphatase II / sedoheptulose-1,7-bisphosphatase
MADLDTATYQAQDRNLALDLVRVTEAAALAASRWMGRGNKIEADGAATEAMRRAFDTMQIDGTVVIGEGEMDEAPMLYIGEKVGAGGPAMDIAVDPLEGTTLTAKGGPNALTVIALAERGKFLHAPDCYMDKIAVGRWAAGRTIVHLDATGGGEPAQPCCRAKKRVVIEDLVVCTLDRDRHAETDREVRAKLGARIMLLGGWRRGRRDRGGDAG